VWGRERKLEEDCVETEGTFDGRTDEIFISLGVESDRSGAEEWDISFEGFASVQLQEITRQARSYLLPLTGTFTANDRLSRVSPRLLLTVVGVLDFRELHMEISCFEQKRNVQEQ
jgi:hypothetical protein